MDAPGHFLPGAHRRAGGRHTTRSPTAATGMKDAKDKESVRGKEEGGINVFFHFPISYFLNR
jgi:hypothetical protein